MRRLLRTSTEKGLCGFLIALVLFATPLPAFAETDPAASSATATSAASPPQPEEKPAEFAQPVVSAVPQATVTLTTDVAATPNLEVASSTNLNTSNGNLQPVASQPQPTNQPVTPNIPGSAPAAGNTTSAATNVNSDTTSGNATVNKNRNGGDATSGNATTDATIINMANSTAGSGAGTVVTYRCDIRGNQRGDIIIDPSALQKNVLVDPSTLQPMCEANSSNAQQAGSDSNGIQQSASLTDITNNIVLNATSGNATVADNRNGGDATSGDAIAMANIINVVNSAINAQHSFLGFLNIYGSLQGDILVPKSFVDGLLSNSGSSNAASSAVAAGTLNINNSILANAASGNAAVAGNRNGGAATSGDATTSVTVLNLTGQQVVAKNSLLVFVNVLGQWVGMIVQAPGSTTAAYGGGIANNLQSQINNSVNAKDSTANITNNVSVNATSGKAAVTNNRNGGDATSGKAQAGVNILNIANSNFNLGDWFGALFINVFGSWLGNFGIKDNTPVVAVDPTSATTDKTQPIQDIKVYQFDSETTVAPVTASTSRNDDSNRGGRAVAVSLSTVADTRPATGTVLGANTTKFNNTPDAAGTTHNVDIIALVAIIGALTLLVALGSLAIRRRLLAAA